MILANSELSSINGGLAGVRVSEGAIGGGASFEVVIDGCTFSFVLRSCSRIFGSGGIDLLLSSEPGAAGAGLGVGVGSG